MIEVFDAATSGHALPPPAPAAALPPLPVEQPPFCQGCAAVKLWRDGVAYHPLADGPLTRGELAVFPAIRLIVNLEVNARVKRELEQGAEKACTEIRKALGLPEPKTTKRGGRTTR
ncbi:hypothetical protein WCLP8_3650003 [uncultured Gammaproteobacteria bacterium]